MVIFNCLSMNSNENDSMVKFVEDGPNSISCHGSDGYLSAVHHRGLVPRPDHMSFFMDKVAPLEVFL